MPSDHPPAAVAFTRVAAGLRISGEFDASEDLQVDGRIDGQVRAPDHHLMIGRSGLVKARIVARAVTVAGTVDGTILASERVDILASASVRGHVTTPSITILDGARFNGSIDPQRTEAAMRVARYRQKHGGDATPTPTPELVR